MTLGRFESSRLCPRPLLAALLLAALVSGCTFGPKYLKDGHLAYNEAVRAASDRELLLNIVRVRYLDTVEFLGTNSVSAQLSFSVGVGGSFGTDDGDAEALGFGNAQWASRPTFTFTPQRGAEFAEQMTSPVPLEGMIDLMAAEWDASVLFRLLVQNANGLENALGMVNEDFIEMTRLLLELQGQADLYFGSIERRDVLSDPIPASRVSGSDLVAAAKEGFRFERAPSGDGFVLTRKRSQPVMYVPRDAPKRDRLLELLHLQMGEAGYAEIRSGAHPEALSGPIDHIVVDTRSVLDAVAYLAVGVEVPTAHVEKGWTLAEWPATGNRSPRLPELFRIRSAEDRPPATLSVRYRDRWFYLADDDLRSRTTFMVIAELLRLALSPDPGKTPVLTLPVGGA